MRNEDLRKWLIVRISQQQAMKNSAAPTAVHYHDGQVQACQDLLELIPCCKKPEKTEKPKK